MENPLLAMVIRFLNTGVGKADVLQERVGSATIDELVPTFAYLNFWFNSSSKSHKTPQLLAMEQVVFALLSQIVASVPPVTLLFRTSDLNWRMNQRNGALYSVYDGMFHRLRKVRSYFECYFTENRILGIHSLFECDDQIDWKVRGQLMELETDANCQSAYKRQFVKLILNRAPIAEFRHLLQHRNSKVVLTSAIKKILKKLNSMRGVSHAQLVCSFSIVFLYIQAFTASKDINGQMICEYLLAKPFLSPFCLLALINHIPQTLYFFNLLIPKQLTNEVPSPEKAVQIIRDHFMMVDLSGDHELDTVIRMMPEILTSYFLSSPMPSGDFGTMKDNASIIIDFHVKGTSTYDRMKGLIDIAKSNLVEPLVVCASSSQLLNCVICSFQKAFADCYRHDMFTPVLCEFLKAVISIVYPTHGQQVVPKFLDPSFLHDNGKRKTAELVIRAVMRYCSHLYPASSCQRYIIPFCFEAVKCGDDLAIAARTTASKIMHSCTPRFDDAIVERLSECCDLVILLDYMEATLGYMRVNTFEEHLKLEEIRNNVIMKQLRTIPLTFGETDEGLIIKASPTASVDAPTFVEPETWRKVALILNENIYVNDFADDFSYNSILAVRIATQCERMSNKHFADLVAKKTAALVTEAQDKNHCIGSECHSFPIRMLDVIFPILQYALSRFASLDYLDLATNLLKLSEPLIARETLVLPWVTRFTRKFYMKFTNEMRAVIATKMLPSIPGYDQYYRENVDKMLELLQENETVYCRSPEIITSAYTSTYAQIMDFSVCSILLSCRSPAQIVSELLQQVVDISQTKVKRSQRLGIISHLAAELPSAIGISFFEELMKHPSLEAAVDTARLLLVRAGLDVVLNICERAKALIRRDERVLTAYIDAVVPSFPRLNGNKAVATKMLCGMIESLTANSPRHQQDKVIDVVALVYVTLKLQSSRGTIIASGNPTGNTDDGLPPELKTMLATTLDVE